VEFATYGDMKNVIAKLDNTEINGRRIRIIQQKAPGRRDRYDLSGSLRDLVCSLAFYT